MTHLTMARCQHAYSKQNLPQSDETKGVSMPATTKRN